MQSLQLNNKQRSTINQNLQYINEFTQRENKSRTSPQCNGFVIMNYTKLIFTMFIYNIYIHTYQHANIHTHKVSLVIKVLLQSSLFSPPLSRLTSAGANKSGHQWNVPNQQSPVHITQIWFHYHK